MWSLLGWAIVAALIALGFYGLRQGRGIPPSGRRHTDWLRTAFGNPRLPGDRDLKTDDWDRDHDKRA